MFNDAVLTIFSIFTEDFIRADGLVLPQSLRHLYSMYQNHSILKYSQLSLHTNTSFVLSSEGQATQAPLTRNLAQRQALRLRLATLRVARLGAVLAPRPTMTSVDKRAVGISHYQWIGRHCTLNLDVFLMIRNGPPCSRSTIRQSSTDETLSEKRVGSPKLETPDCCKPETGSNCMYPCESRIESAYWQQVSIWSRTDVPSRTTAARV